MASYDQLPAQQQAIVDLILKRGQSYDQLADKLGMPVARVRELARETLTGLAPLSAAEVDDGWRAQIADYLLGQQSAPEAAATRGHLRRSEAARAWSRSVLDSLDHLYANGDMPTIPAGDGSPEPTGGPAAETGPGAPPASDGRRTDSELSPEARAIVRRRRIAGGAAIAVALALLLLVWPVGLLTGGGDDDAADGADNGDAPAQAAGEDPRILGQVLLRPVGDADREAHAGLVFVTEGQDGPDLNIQAILEPSGERQAYEVWLTGPGRDPVSLGAQVTDQQGVFAGRRSLPADYQDYRAIEVTREPIDDDESQSDAVVLRARVADIAAPQDNGGGGEAGGGSGAGGAGAGGARGD